LATEFVPHKVTKGQPLRNRCGAPLRHQKSQMGVEGNAMQCQQQCMFFLPLLLPLPLLTLW